MRQIGKKTIINVIVSMVSQLIIVILGFVVPKVVLVGYGSDINGLTNTIGQVFGYMALLEAGISVSARNAFYKPIKDNNREEISFVASVAKKYYKRIAIIYMLVVLAVSFLFPLIIKTSVAYHIVGLYIFFEGIASVVRFYFLNTWISFLSANGNYYVINAITLIQKVLVYLVQISFALVGAPIIYIQVGNVVVSLIQLALFYMYMKKHFGWITYKIDTHDSVLPEKNDNLISEVAGVVFRSTDAIVLSVFVSTISASIYSIYNMIFIALNLLITSIFQSINYHLGQTYNSDDKKRYIKVHDFFNISFIGGITVLVSVAYVLCIPFIKLYTQGVTDADYVNYKLPFLFCTIQFLTWCRYVAGNLIGISFRQKKAIPINIAEAVVNVIMSIVLVQLLGIEGVLVATIIALPIKVIYCNYIADIVILKRSVWKTFSIIVSNALFFLLCVVIEKKINIEVNSIGEFIIVGVFVFGIVSVLVFGINIIVNLNVLRFFKARKEKRSGKNKK